MQRLDAMRVLLAAVDEGSLAKGGQRLSRSPASVSRAIAGLEQVAGELLLHRSARGLKLTAAGQRHVAVYRQVLAALDQLTPDTSAPQELRGVVRVTAPEMFGQLNVLPVVESFQDRHPGIAVKLYLQNRLTDLVEEGIDVAVRLAVLPDSRLTAIRLGSMKRLVCAAPSYLARYGTPMRPADLRQHQCIGRNLAGDADLWSFAFATGGIPRIRSLAVPSRLTVGSVAAALSLVRAGCGIGQFMAYQVAGDIEAGRLERLLVAHELPPVPVHLVFSGAVHPGGCVRAFVEHVTPRLRRSLVGIQRALGGEV